jgi:DNA-binding NtrC family response regulator
VPLLKKINGTIPVIAVSAQEGLHFVRKLRNPGIFYQAMKPIDLEEIRSAVECAFEKIKRESLREELVTLFMQGSVPALGTI